MPMTVPLCKVGDLKDGEMRHFELMGFDLLLVRLGGEWFCVDYLCTYSAGDKSEWKLDPAARTVTCAKDGSVFSLESGEAVKPPATFPLQKYTTWEEGDELMLEFVY
jgi:nitrite reductase/ring-hydroxylating ferredoxin subunit